MPRDDFYQRNKDLDEAGLYQLAAEEAARPGKRTPKSTQILKGLVDGLGLFDAQVREIEDLVEQKRRAGLLGKVRKFSRRQLYARCIRYTHHAGDPSPANAELLETLRDAMGFDAQDHEQLLERLIDQGWAPPGPLTRSGMNLPKKSSPEGGAPDSPPAAPRVAPPPAAPGVAPDDEQSESQDLKVRPTASHVKVAAAEGMFEDVTPSGALELRGEPESVDNLAFDPFETTAGANRLARKAAAEGPAPGMSTRQQFWMGAGIGALVVMIPLAFWMGTRQGPPPPAPTVEEWPTVPPTPPPPTPSPSPKPTPPPKPPADPWKAFLDSLPPTGESMVSGVKLLQAMGTRLLEADEVAKPLAEHAQSHRDAINQTFARRNEQIFEAAQWGGEFGGYHKEALQEARAALADAPKAELPSRLVHAYYQGLLAFYIEAALYPKHSDVYSELVPAWVALLKKRPALARSGAGMVLRVIGEDLRDGQDEALSKLGVQLLDALL